MISSTSRTVESTSGLPVVLAESIKAKKSSNSLLPPSAITNAPDAIEKLHYITAMYYTLG